MCSEIIILSGVLFGVTLVVDTFEESCSSGLFLFCSNWSWPNANGKLSWIIWFLYFSKFLSLEKLIFSFPLFLLSEEFWVRSSLISVMKLSCSLLYLSKSLRDSSLNLSSSSLVMFYQIRPTSFIMSRDAILGLSLTTFGLVYM